MPSIICWFQRKHKICDEIPYVWIEGGHCKKYWRNSFRFGSPVGVRPLTKCTFSVEVWPIIGHALGVGETCNPVHCLHAMRSIFSNAILKRKQQLLSAINWVIYNHLKRLLSTVDVTSILPMNVRSASVGPRNSRAILIFHFQISISSIRASGLLPLFSIQYT